MSRILTSLFGDPFAQDVTGGRNIRSSLNKWDDFSWKGI